MNAERQSNQRIPFTAQELINGLEMQLRLLADAIGANEQDLLAAPNRAGAASEDAVRTEIRSRSQREKFFTNNLFSDPAWDMLLELYLSEIVQRRVTISGLCLASKAPSTTALRWLSFLESKGLVDRTSDPLDKRRYFISLSVKGSQAMDEYFASLMPLARRSSDLHSWRQAAER